MSDFSVILRQVGRKHMMMPDEIRSGKRHQSLRKPRNEVAFRLYSETNRSQKSIADFLNMSDHTAVRHMILTHAKSIGMPITRVTDLRDGQKATAIDWTLFGYAVAAWLESAGLSQNQAARRCRVSRPTIRKAQNGERLDADTYILIREGAKLDEAAFVRLPGASRETLVKQAWGIAGEIRNA